MGRVHLVIVEDVSESTARPVVIDTMVASALLRRERRLDEVTPYDLLVRDRAIVVSFATVAELRFGALNAGWGELRMRSLHRSLSALTVVEPAGDVVQRWAELRVECSRLGHPLGQKVHDSDRWIAATALARDLELVSDDRVFEASPRCIAARLSARNRTRPSVYL